jgi:molybdopterin biosynthesis enzyme
VRSGDLSQLSAILDVIGEIKAGERLDRIPASIDRGQAVAIMTGAPVPAGADAVVMVEHTSQREKQLETTGVEITVVEINRAWRLGRMSFPAVPKPCRVPCWSRAVYA